MSLRGKKKHLRKQCIEYEKSAPHAMTGHHPVRGRATRRFAEHIFSGDVDDARRLERELFNWTVRTARGDLVPQFWSNPRFLYKYKTKAMSVEFNLKNPKNPALRERFLRGDIPYSTFMYIHPYQLFPELWEPVFERVAAKQLRKQLTHDLDTVPDGAFQCSKCKSKKTTYTELQTRSADEPATLYIQCMACSKRWKQ